MSKDSKNLSDGTSFDDFLDEEGLLEESSAVAIKRVLAWQIRDKMEKDGLTKTTMAKLMKTSRSQLERLLDPQKTGTSLELMQRAASAVGHKLQINLI